MKGPFSSSVSSRANLGIDRGEGEGDGGPNTETGERGTGRRDGGKVALPCPSFGFTSK